MPPRKKIWIHAEYAYNGSELLTVSFLADLFKKHNIEPILLTNKHTIDLLNQAHARIEDLQTIILPDPVKLPNDPKYVREQNHKRFEAAREASRKPLTAPDAILIMRPINARVSHFFPALAKLVKRKQVKLISIVRDITGIYPEDMWPKLNLLSDRIYLVGGSGPLSDFNELEARFSMHKTPPEKQVSMRSFHNDTVQLNQSERQAIETETSGEILVQVGNTMNDSFVDAKQKMYELAMRAWASDPQLRKHRLRLLIPADVSPTIWNELEKVQQSLDSEHILLVTNDPQHVFYERCKYCDLLITTGGSSVVDATYHGAPMIIAPCPQTSLEQSIRAKKMCETGLLSPIGTQLDGTPLYPVIWPSQVENNEISPDKMAEMMKGAMQQSRSDIRSKAAMYIKGGALSALVDDLARYIITPAKQIS